MKATQVPVSPPHSGEHGAVRLLSLVDRSAPPHRPVGGLLHRWYVASGTRLLLDEWADPATRALAAAFDGGVDLTTVEQAIVAFAQARAGADHGADAVTADLVALVRLAWPPGRGTWGEDVDPVGLFARALGAWAVEHTAAASCGQCLDAVTGLASPNYLRERLRELHAQCEALAIAPPVAFGALVVHLDPRSATAIERIGLRVALGRALAARFRAGETVAALGATRFVAVMPACGIDRAVHDLTSDLAELAERDDVGITIDRLVFACDAASTFRSLAGTKVRS
jgi:hypothetical protein